ncbi:MAG: DUF4838 domain-containing protein [Planctomycetes bacterium]|nr:DUF4838 domain-containing protein [Planctomycetota bacterium]
MLKKICLPGLALALLTVLGTVVNAADIRLAENVKDRCVIVAPDEIMKWEGDEKRIRRGRRCPTPEYIAENRRRIRRDSVHDLALYLGKISGATIEIVSELPKGDKRTPIYIDAAAKKVFGPVGTPKGKVREFRFRVVADPAKGLGLYGPSPLGTSYAIYELLHRLGCRWYMPSEMGEVVPKDPDLSVEPMDLKLAPATEARGLWKRTTTPDFSRRNRLSGNPVSAGHRLSKYTKWWDEEAAEKEAENVIEKLDKNYVPSISLSPNDGVIPTENEGRAVDPEPRVWEPAAGRWSVTDRVILFANRVAERVTKKYSDVTFGLLAYVNYTSPPQQEKVHPNVIPVLAPIDFNRHHPMNWPDHPNEYWLLDRVVGWGKMCEGWAAYWYMMNLAETTAPCPFITKMGTDIKIMLDNNMAFWTPETMGGWESMMPGYYLTIRMTFYPEETPDEILDEMWTLFYGPAAEPMERYWRGIDRAWIEAEEYSGSLFGYLRIFTPEVMAEARKNVDDALAACEKGSAEYERVELVNASLTLFEHFMKMRHDWANARLKNLKSDLQTWREMLRANIEKYADQKTFRAEPWSPGGAKGGMSEWYIDCFVGHAYDGGSEMEAEYVRVGEPMLEWKWRYNPDAEEASIPWTKPDYSDVNWKTTHVVRETWSTIGHHNSMTDKPSGRSGRMAYRKSQTLPAVPKGKKVFLWIGATDGKAKVFVNGKHIKYELPHDTRSQKKGDKVDFFNGYCKPAKFDITSALKEGENQFTILCDRHFLNELGTGGLMGPVIIFREK